MSKQSLLVAAAVATVSFFSACGQDDIQSFGRQQLFTLGYGKTDAELDLFEKPGAASLLKTRIAMRSGLFYIANGPAHKIIKLSSYGDILSMIYNEEYNPEPVLLKPYSGGEITLKTAQKYPLESAGELAVDSKGTIYVEDRVPLSRRVFDENNNALLSYVVSRFDANGTFRDYLGQEGIGGTPFPLVLSVKTTLNDDCVVVSMSQDAWFVHRFDPAGTLIRAITVNRQELPDPTGEGLIAELDKIIPAPEGRSLFLKVDFYRELEDSQTKTQSGVEYASSYLFRMDEDGVNYRERWEIPPFMVPGEGQSVSGVRVYELLGAVKGGKIFLLATDSEGMTYLGIYDLGSKSIRKYAIELKPEELKYSTFHLSDEGILTALLATEYEVRVVWWRYDTLFAGFAQ